jgi:predicted nucleic acid-binding protein
MNKEVENEAFFFDSYAIMELLEGNPAYLPYENVQGVLTIFNIAELNYAMKRDGKKQADELTRRYFSMRVPVIERDIAESMSFRIQHKKLSIPDAIGYVVAKRLGIRFLTGDQEFERMENVEFVK